LPEYPALFIFHPLAEEILHGDERRLARKAIINVLIVLVGFEPQFVGVGNEYKAEEQEKYDKTKGRFAKVAHTC
jgi:hypothetical protein